jgi:hypothetical protein
VIQAGPHFRNTAVQAGQQIRVAPGHHGHVNVITDRDLMSGCDQVLPLAEHGHCDDDAVIQSHGGFNVGVAYRSPLFVANVQPAGPESARGVRVASADPQRRLA